MSEEKKGIEGLKKVMGLLVKNIKLGEEISKDGLKPDDLQYADDVVANAKEIIEFIASKPELAEEVKDIDFMEGVELAKAAYEGFKEVAE
jgi:hypothetical protein